MNLKYIKINNRYTNGKHLEMLIRIYMLKRTRQNATLNNSKDIDIFFLLMDDFHRISWK